MKPTILAVEIGGSGARITRTCGSEQESKTFQEIASPQDLVDNIILAGGEQTDAIVVSVSGFVRDGVIELSTNTHFPASLPLREMVARATGKPTQVLNDLYIAGIGAGVAIRQLEGTRYNCINLGSGVGQCACHHGKVIGSCEFGHARYADRLVGKQCSCKKRGCFESVLGGNSLKRETISTTTSLGIEIPDRMSPCAFLDRSYVSGAEWAIEIYKQFSHALGIYIGSFQLAIPAPVYVLRGSVAQISLRLDGIMDDAMRVVEDELRDPTWIPEIMIIPPPGPGQVKDYDAVLGAQKIGLEMLASG